MPDVPDTNAIIIDSTVVMNILSLTHAKTFGEYAVTTFQPFVARSLQNVARIDLVLNRYFEKSLKERIRATQGKGIRRRVRPTGVPPTYWQQFLSVKQNKTELFNFLAEHTEEVFTEE